MIDDHIITTDVLCGQDIIMDEWINYGIQRMVNLT